MEKVVSHGRIVRKYSPEAKRYIGLVLRHGTPGQVMIVRGILKTHSRASSYPTKVIDIRRPQKAYSHLLERYKVHTYDKWVTRVRIAPRKPLHCRRQSFRGMGDITRVLKTEKAATYTHKRWQQRVAHSATSVLKTMLKVKIAHGMDPVQRAGQTKESNAREAAIYGRALKSQNKRGISFIFKLLMNLLFALIFPLMFKGDTMVQYILKGLEHQQKKKEKDSGCRYGSACIAR